VNLMIWELISIVLSTLVTGVIWGPWVALSRSISTFAPEVILAIVNRLSRNTAPVMMSLPKTPYSLIRLNLVPVTIACPSHVDDHFLALFFDSARISNPRNAAG